MNAKLYRHVFNKSLGCLVAAPEIAHSRMKVGATGAASHHMPAMRPLGMALAMLMGGALHAQTLPTGGSIVGGQGHIGTAGNTMTVQQNSPRLAINWNSFDIGAGNTVVFNQPSSNAVALNSVLGNNPSQIYGNLQANGQVFLINPNGVLFGKSAQVNVGGLFASTLPINASVFMQGNGSYTFSRAAGSASGQVINQGHLHAVNGGFVVLAGNQVINSGTIDATLGTVSLASGDSVTLNLDNAGQLTVNVNAATLGALIQNQGLIEADGGQVLLTARGIDMLQSNVMNLSGVLDARSIGTRNGKVIIDGGDASQGDSGMVSLVNASIDASGANAGEQGGTVIITGPHVNLQGSAINVSGNTGGGIALIGGGPHGQGTLTHALTTTVDANSTIDASATGNGNGGTVVLWSDEETDFDGAILGRGGMLGGNGGWVETSSEGGVHFRGNVTTRAPHGVQGTLLIDPDNIVIGNGSSNPSPVNWTDVSCASDVTSNITIGMADLSAELNSTSVQMVAKNNITDQAGVSVTGTTGTLIFQAGNVSLTGSYNVAGGVVFNVTGTALVAGVISGTGGLTQAGTGITILAGNNTYSGVTAINAGTLQVGNAGTTGSLGTGPVTDSANLVLNLSGTTTVSGLISGTGSLSQVGTGTTILAANNTYSGTTTISAGTLQVGNGGTTGNLGTGTVTDNAALVFNRSNPATVSTLIGGTGTLTQAGTGTVILTANNTYSGGTAINAGTTLQVGNGSTTGNLGTGAVANNGNLTFDTTGTTTIAPVISGSGNVSQIGTGTTVLTNNNTYSGSTTISAGTLQVGNGGVSGSLGTAATVTDNANLTFDLSGTTTINTVIAGTGNLTQAGAGTIILTANNTYSGTTTISAGTLQVGNGGTTGSLGTGAVTDNANLTFDLSSNEVVNNTISGGGSLTQAGTGTTILAGNNTYTGTTTISAGTLQVGNGGASGSLGTGSVVDDTALVFNTTGQSNVNGVISGPGTLTQEGTGSTYLLNNNTYSGGTTISAGTLDVGYGGSVGSLGTGPVLDNANLEFQSSTPTTISNPISGTGNLTVYLYGGNGDVVLTGTNTYTGTTNISAGVLQVGNGSTAGSLGTGNVTIASGNNSTLVFDLSDNTTAITGTLSGTGTVENEYLGTVQSLSNVSGFTGTYQVLVNENNASIATFNVPTGSNLTGRTVDVMLSGSANSNTAFTPFAVFNPQNTSYVGTPTMQIDGNTIANATAALGGTLTSYGTNITLSGGYLWELNNGTTTTGFTTLTSSNSYTLSGNAWIAVAPGLTVTESGVLSGNATQLTVQYPGIGPVCTIGCTQPTVILSGNNTYNVTGYTYVGYATLQIGNGGASGSIGNGNVSVQYANSTLAFDVSGTTTANGVISGPGNLIQEGTGTTILAGNNSYSGNTTITAGTLQVGNGGANGSLGTANTITDNGTLAFNLSGTTTFGATITGTGNLAQEGTGTTILTAANSYSGTTNISAGTLQVGNGGGSGSLGTGAIADSGTLTYDLSSSTTVNNPLTGNGTIENVYLGTTQSLSNVTGFIGTYAVSTNEVNASVAGFSLPSGTNLAGNTFDTIITVANSNTSFTPYKVFNSTYTGTPTLEIDGTVVSNGTAAVGGTLTSYNTNITLGGGYLWSLYNGTTTTGFNTLTDSNSYTLSGNSNITVAPGLTVTQSGALSGSGNLAIQEQCSVSPCNASTVILAANNTYTGNTTIGINTTAQVGNGSTTGSLGTGSSVVNNGNLTFDVSGSTTVLGAISGPGNLSQIGTGTAILAANNNYSGTTNISAGTLQIGNGGSTGSIGTGNITDTANLTFNSTGNSTVYGCLSGNGTLTQNGTGVVDIGGGNTSTNNNFPGAVTINAGTLIGDGGNTQYGALGDGTTITVNNGGTFEAGANTNGLVGTAQSATIILNNGSVLTTSSNSTADTLGPLTLNGGTLADQGSVTGNATAYGAWYLTKNVTVTANSTISAVGVTFDQSGGTIVNIASGDQLLVNGTLIYAPSASNTGMNLTGPGTMVLTGTNNYTGTTVITNGTLQVGNGSSTGSLGTGPVTDNANLTFDLSSTATISGAISGKGNLSQVGTGATILAANNTYSGTTTISNGTLQVGSGSTTGSLGTGNVTDNANLTFDVSGTTMVNGSISGTGNLTQAGTGTTVLSANNTYSGNTTISAGTLQVGNGGANGSLGTASTVTDNGNLTFDLSSNTTVNATIGGTGNLIQEGTGTTTLAANNTYSGTTAITAGTLQVGNGSASGSLGTGSVTDSGNLSFDLSDNTTIANTISGSGTLENLYLGTVQNLSSVSGFTGTYAALANEDTASIASFNVPTGTNLAANTFDVILVQADPNAAFAPFPVFNLQGSYVGTPTLEIDGSVVGNGSAAVGGTLTSYNTNITLGGGYLWALNNGTTTTYYNTTLGSTTTALTGNATITVAPGLTVTEAGLLSGSGNLTIEQCGFAQCSPSTTVLTANNTYTGTTNITSGTLQIGNGSTSGSLGTGNVIDSSNLTFDVSGTTTVAGAISGTGNLSQAGTGTTILAANNNYSGNTTISSGTLQIGNGGTTGSLGTASSITDNANLAFDLSGNTTVNTTISGTGNLTQVGSGTTDLLANNTYTGTTLVSGGTLQVGNGNASGSLGTGAVIDDANLVVNLTSVDWTQNTTGTGNLSLLTTDVGINGGNITIATNISLGGNVTATAGTGVNGNATIVLVNNVTNTMPYTAGGAGGSVIVDAGSTISAANVALTGGAGGVGSIAGTLYTGTTYGAAAGAGGAGGSVIVDGTTTATSTLALTAGNGGGGGAGDGSGSPCCQGGPGTGQAGGAGGAGGAVAVDANLSANSVAVTSGSGGGGGGGGASGGGNQPPSAGGAGGAAGTLTLADTVINATNTTITGGNGGGGGGAGQGGQFYVPGSNGTAGITGGAGGNGGAASSSTPGAGSTGGAASSNGGVGSVGGSGGGAGGAGSVVYVTCTSATITGGNVGVATLGSGIVLTANGTLTVNVTGSPTIANQISGPGNLTQAGPGTMTLSGADTYTGTTTIADGTLNITGSLNVGGGTANVVMANGTTFAAGGITAALTNISGSGNITLAGVTTNGSIVANTTNTAANSTADLTLSANLTAGGNVTLVAGANGTSGLPSGTDTAGNVLTTNGAEIILPNASTLVVYTGDDNVAQLDSAVIGATGPTDQLTYNATLGNLANVTAGTRNFDVRTQPNLSGVFTANKTYDGNNNALSVLNIGSSSVLGSIGGPGGCTSVAINTSSLNITGAVFNTSQAGTNLTVTVDAGTTRLNASFDGASWNVTMTDPVISNPNGGGTITPANLTITAGSETKVYDGTTASNVTAGVTGLVAGDTISNAALAQTYNSSHVLGTNGSLLNVAAALINSSLASSVGSTLADYNITYVTANGTITPAPVTVTASTQTKVFDGTTTSNVAVTNITGLVAGDNLSGLFQAYNSSQVLGTNGSTLIVNNSGIGVTGNHSSVLSDYSITYVNTTGTITPAPVIVTATTQTKVYDGTTTSNQGVTNITGLVSGDNLTGLFQVYNSSQVQGTNGSLLVVNNSGVGLGSSRGDTLNDYTVSYVSTPGTITPAPVTVTASTETKVYDGTTVSNVAVTNITGLVAGDGLTGLSQYYNSSQVLGTNGSTLIVNNSGVGVTGNHSSTLGDYSITYVNTAGTITPAPVTVTASTDTKVFDGTTVSNQSVTNITGLVAGDSLTGLSQSYNSSQVLGTNGSMLIVNGSGVGVAGNVGSTTNDYSISYVTTPGTITPAPVTVTAASDTKVYDGTTVSNQSVTNISGLVAGDSLSGLFQAYNSSHAQGTDGSLLAVNSSGVGLSSSAGDSLNDYTISYVSTPGTITPAPVTVTASTATKVYDSTTTSNVAVTNITGLVAGDSLTGLSQYYNNSQVLGTNGSTLIVNNSGVGVRGNDGSLLSDYAITYANSTGTITPAPVIVTASTETKVFDGTTVSNVAVTNITGLVAGDSLTGLSQYYNSSQVLGTNGSTLIVNSNGAGVTGNHSSTLSDYSITYANTTGTITPRDVTIDLNNVTKVYDGTTIAFADGGVAAPGTGTTGLIAGDTITGITGNGTYNSAHVLSANAANFTLANLAIGLSGNDLADYAVTLVQPVSATITPAPVSVTATSQTKMYDGTTVSGVPITNITGLLAGDNLTGLTQAYTNPNVAGSNGSTLLVNSSGVGISGNDGSLLSDYAISYFTSPGTITPKPVTALNVTLNSNDTLNISQASLSGVLPGQTLTIVQGSTPGTLALAGPTAGDYVLTDPYAGAPPLVHVFKWQGALYAARYPNSLWQGALYGAQFMIGVIPQPWLTVTQSPQSSQMLEVADTGQPPTHGPVNAVASESPASGLYCVQGAIRVPDGVNAMPVTNCDQPHRMSGI